MGVKQPYNLHGADMLARILNQGIGGNPGDHGRRTKGGGYHSRGVIHDMILVAIPSSRSHTPGMVVVQLCFKGAHASQVAWLRTDVVVVVYPGLASNPFEQTAPYST
jgi:hypothetical protein